MADFAHKPVASWVQGKSVGLCVPHMTMENYVDSLSRWTDSALLEKADSLKKLTSLVLYGRAVSDYGIKVLERCEQLRELHLVDTNVTDRGLASLANLRSLRWLSIDTADITDSGIMQFKNLNQLEGLQLVKTGASDDGLAILLNFPNLEYLEISGCVIAEKGVLYISQVGSLNSLRLAAPTVFDDAFLGLSYCKRLSKFSFDMPLVSSEAVQGLRLLLPNCELGPYTFFRPEEKVLYLVTNFIGERRTLANFSDALLCANELLTYSPYHPALHCARALINFRMGNFDGFRNDLRSTRDNANMYGQQDLLRMAMNYLSQPSFFNLRMMMEEQNPDVFIANKLLTSGVRPPTRKEPINALINRMSSSAQAPITPERAQAAAAAFSTPLYRHPSAFVDLSNRRKLILPEELKDELKSVPWNW